LARLAEIPTGFVRTSLGRHEALGDRTAKSGAGAALEPWEACQQRLMELAAGADAKGAGGGAPRALQHVTKRSMVLGRLPLYGEPEVSPDRSQASSLSAEELVVAYHERTKHHFHRFAASVGYMDWAT
jgi:hypothetical protein